MTTKRAFIMARVSTTDQAEKGYSLPSQLAACRKYAVEHDYEVTGEAADDCSGTIPVAERPGGARLYQALRERVVNVVVCYTIDRSARDKRDYPIEFMTFLADVQDAGAELHFVDTGKSDGGILDLFKAWQAGEERKKIIERTTRGRLAKAKAGKWVGSGEPPYGFAREGKELVIYWPEAEIVRKIFIWYTGADGNKSKNIVEIIRLLTADQTPPPGGRAGPGRGWHDATLMRLIDRRVYLGEFSYGGIVVSLPHLALIDPAVFDLAQERRKINREFSSRNRKREYLLSGRIRCACGAAMGGHTTADIYKGKRYESSRYRCACASSSRRRHLSDCREPNLNVKLIDPLVWEWAYGLIDNDAKLTKGINDMRQQGAEQNSGRRERLAKIDERLTKAERKVKRLAAAVGRAEDEEDETSAEALEAELRAASRELAGLIAEQKRLLGEVAQVEFTAEREARLRAALRAIRARLDNPTFERKREVLELLDLRAQLRRDDEGYRVLDVTCRIDFTTLYIDLPSSKGKQANQQSFIVLSVTLPIDRRPGDLAEALFTRAGVAA